MIFKLGVQLEDIKKAIYAEQHLTDLKTSELKAKVDAL